MNTEWKPIASAPKDELILVGPTKRMGICVAMNHSRDGWVTETCNEWCSIYTPTHWMPLPAEPCLTCNGHGMIGGLTPHSGYDAEPCPDCSPPAPTSHPIPTGATGEDGRSATYGMTLGERIAHVGGRTNAQGYTEFGSPMAVNALIQHVLRDLYWTRQDDDGAYQARYRLPGGEWSSWGHVVCGVKGHEQELRYLPGERRPAPAAGDALDVLLLTQALQDLRQAFVIAVGDKSPFARIALEKADAAIAASQQGGE